MKIDHIIRKHTHGSDELPYTGGSVNLIQKQKPVSGRNKHILYIPGLKARLLPGRFMMVMLIVPVIEDIQCSIPVLPEYQSA